MKITILGTGTSQGIPVIGCDCTVCSSMDKRDKRLRTSVLVQTAESNIVIDIGPDFRAQMLAHYPGRIDGVLLTHEHNDHTAGLDDIRPFNFKFKKDVPIYGLERVLKDLQSRFSYVFSGNHYPGIPRLDVEEVKPWKNFKINGLDIEPIPVHHGKLEILGYKIGDFCYLTDVKRLDDEVVQKLTGIKCLVISALHHQKHHSHLNLKEALDLIKLIRPQTAYLTHLSHQMGLHKEVEIQLLENVKLAYDGLIIEL